MRWIFSTLGLAALPLVSAQTSIGSMIIFQPDDYEPYAIFYPDPFLPDSSSKTLSFNASSHITISNVLLKAGTASSATIIGTGEPVTTDPSTTTSTGTDSDLNSKKTGLIFVEPRVSTADVAPVSLQVNVTYSEDDGTLSGHVTIPFGDSMKEYYNMTMFLEVYWDSVTSTQMLSASRAFTLTNVNPKMNLQAYEQLLSANQQFLKTTPVESQTYASTGVPSIVVTPAPAVTSDSGSTIPSSAASPADASTSGGGLSTGAKAGIAVACAVVGIVLIAALIWLFCLRNRRRTDHVRTAPYGNVAASQSNVPDKEMPNTMADSPHSPYAEDGGQLQDRAYVSDQRSSMRRSMPPPPPPPAQASHHDLSHHDAGAGSGTYTPYTEGPTTPMPAPSTAAHASSQQDLPQPAPGTGSPTPPQPPRGVGMSHSRYAHLIEEGMTQDEIRRLEEEERQLDAAIEEHDGRNSRAH